MCKHKKALAVHELFVKFTSCFGIQPTLEAYYVLIEGFLDVHLTDMAWGLFKEMKTVGCAPDFFTYNLLLDDLGKSGRVDEIFELHEEMLSRGCKPNTITHNIVIDGLVKCNRIEKAVDLYYDLINGDFNPTPCTYGPLIDGLLKLGNLDEARSFFVEMVDYGCKPNCAIYNILINGFGKGGDVETACELFNRMVKEGIRLDLKSHTILVDCLCMVGKVDDVVHYFEELKSTGIDPDLRFGNPDRAYAVYEKMMAGGCSPNPGHLHGFLITFECFGVTPRLFIVLISDAGTQGTNLYKKNRKLQTSKQKRDILLAEAGFLRPRCRYLLKIQSPKLEEDLVQPRNSVSFQLYDLKQQGFIERQELMSWTGNLLTEL
ncbi:Pentatricopeptide repeat-containing protein [Camellia lanceoleosa]|uniref:Pentatricopeptide repeat-containing protein n=1 Tax=Camellia lanceoleosa TaxID=1840588 RepID=A0ACC0I6C8_9ERIC|nr:Pentatricopeptide repeat-containing protein [Camellia lanceoleosa]